MKKIGKINLKNVSAILSEQEMKLVVGGSDCKADCGVYITNCNGTCSSTSDCAKCEGQSETLTKCCKY